MALLKRTPPPLPSAGSCPFRTAVAAEHGIGKEFTEEKPELLISPFSKRDLNQVHECLRAIASIEAQGMKVVTQIELAATLLASACEHGYASGEETAGEGGGPDLYALTERLVHKRAREIYAQGRM